MFISAYKQINNIYCNSAGFCVIFNIFTFSIFFDYWTSISILLVLNVIIIMTKKYFWFCTFSLGYNIYLRGSLLPMHLQRFFTSDQIMLKCKTVQNLTLATLNVFGQFSKFFCISCCKWTFCQGFRAVWVPTAGSDLIIQ